MPASDISRITHSFPPGVSEWARAACASLAEKAARSQVAEKIRTGALSRDNRDAVNEAYKLIYYSEYYRNMAFFEQSGQAPKVVYVEADNKKSLRYLGRHAAVNFSKLNCFIHVQHDSITVGRFNYPLDGETESPETKEAFISAWPGPLDKLDNRMRHKVNDYIDTLLQHHSLRKIRYCDPTNDERRVDILNLLRELNRQHGSIDAAGITRLLLDPRETEIKKEDSHRNPIETIQKYLLLGKRADAIKFARIKKLFEHAQCLAFLDKYQPPNTVKYVKDGLKLKDDSIVLLNDDYINSLKDSVLKTVYRSLLNRMLETDPESRNVIKRPYVTSNNYEFAILSANDCEMDFDQSNEVFKLIKAVKRMPTDPFEAYQHLISLGFTQLDLCDAQAIDDMSLRSHLSFKSGDTYASRTLIISNFDMLLLNEIWEYCLNLARGTCDPSNYRYIINLIPYKLVFASRLFDFGLHNMFAQYLDSIRNSLAQARAQQYQLGDAFYDWTSIEASVDYLWQKWKLFQSSSETLSNYGAPNPDLSPFQSNTYEPSYAAGAPEISHPLEQNEVPYYNNYQNEWDPEPIQETEVPQAQPYQHESLSQHQQLYQQQPPQQHQQSRQQQPQQQQQHQRLPQQQQSQQQVPQQQHFTTQEPLSTQPFNMEPLANQLHSLPEMSRYQRPDYPDSSQLIKDYDHKAMKSSSPVNMNRDSMGDSFPFSPIHENVDPQSNNSSRRESVIPNEVSSNNQMVQQQPQASTSDNNSKSQPSGDQQKNFLAGFSSLMGTAKSLLPKSNSKPMILPDDTNKAIDYDPNLGKWVNRSDPNGALEDEVTDAPPLMNNAGPPQYSFKKSSRGRYPTPNFQ